MSNVEEIINILTKARTTTEVGSLRDLARKIDEKCRSREKEAEKQLAYQLKDTMIDEEFMFNMPPIPAWFGTKHGTQNRGELVATKRFMERLAYFIQPYLYPEKETKHE